MLGLDLWVAQVHEQQDVEFDPQVQHNNTFIEIEHTKAGKIKTVNIPFSMSETPGEIKRGSPLIGEHTYEIMQEAGYSQDEIERLLNENTVYKENV